MNTQTKHTPGPWIQENGSIKAVSRGHWFPVARIEKRKFTPEGIEANAAFIVRACNTHDEMLAALKYVVKYHREHDSGEGELFGLDFVTTCIAAIAKAEGQS